MNLVAIHKMTISLFLIQIVLQSTYSPLFVSLSSFCNFVLSFRLFLNGQLRSQHFEALFWQIFFFFFFFFFLADPIKKTDEQRRPTFSTSQKTLKVTIVLLNSVKCWKIILLSHFVFVPHSWKKLVFF